MKSADETSIRASRRPCALFIGRLRLRVPSVPGVGGRAARAAILIGGLAQAFACGGGSQQEAEGPRAYWTNSPPECPVDHTREYYCDDLMPLATGAPAPEPYENCPVQTEAHVGKFEDAPPVSVFDPDFTKHTRLRSPPGHSCCYSWCSRIELAVPDPAAAQAACQKPNAFREEFCFNAPETGTSEPATPTFPACPVAIVPPSTAAFSVPESALFDERSTSQRYAKSVTECCYAWCSEAPPASGLARP